jgi:hypothetical protein
MRLFLVILAALVGAGIGMNQTVTRVYPLPHHIPKYEGGVTLRFAMVHDVIHERFPWHGRAYYEERNRRARAAIADEDARRETGGVPSAAYFALVDDLAVGLDRLGQHREAVALMQEKMRQQEAAGLKGRDLYSSKANLGTFLILWQLQDGFNDRDAAKKRLTEGLALVRESIDVKPDAHFGREVWQAVLLEFLLASLDDPTLLTRFDMVGDHLDSESASIHPGFHRIRYRWKLGRLNRDAAIYLRKQAGENVTDWANVTDPKVFREEIQKVGAEVGWTDAVKSPHKEPVPFDEPVLGIVGMWRYGGGANPHFALALAEIMLRVGQRYIAWCAYERAALLGENVSTDARVVQTFVAYCRGQQDRIEKVLPPEEREQLRPRFLKELAFGQRYQAAYQAYEEKKIREGADIDDPHFYDAFDAEHGPIATPVDEEDQYVIAHGIGSAGLSWGEWFGMVSWAPVVLYAGMFAFGMACLIRLVDRRRGRTGPGLTTTPVPPRSWRPPTDPPPGAITS